MGERAQAVSFPQEKGWANWGVQADPRVKDRTATAAFYETSSAVAAQTEGAERDSVIQSICLQHVPVGRITVVSSAEAPQLDEQRPA